jgi:hypothetical protein
VQLHFWTKTTAQVKNIFFFQTLKKNLKNIMNWLVFKFKNIFGKNMSNSVFNVARRFDYATLAEVTLIETIWGAGKLSGDDLKVV